jgi:beta propeller repeat protein
VKRVWTGLRDIPERRLRRAVPLISSLIAFSLLVAVSAPVGAAGKERAIAVGAQDQVAPDVWCDRVVWADHRNGNYDIYMKDLFTGLETPICTNDPGQQWEPAICGDHIVWWDEREGNFDIYVYDLATATETPIFTNPADQYGPAI